MVDRKVKCVGVAVLFLAAGCAAESSGSAETEQPAAPVTAGASSTPGGAVPGGMTADPAQGAMTQGGMSANHDTGGPAATGGNPTNTGGNPAGNGGNPTQNVGGTPTEPEAMAGAPSGTGGAAGNPMDMGGSGQGGADVVDVPPPDRPGLVTSAPNAYWQESELTEATAATPSLSVDENTTYQEWIGFGGTFNEVGWDVLKLVSDADRDRAIKLLFSAAEGANFAWGRIPMGASDFAIDRYTLHETPEDYAMADFSIDRDRQLMIPYIKAALAVKPSLLLWGSPWSPPAWMKENNDMNGGRIRNEPAVLEAYALYFAMFVEAYEAEGLDIDHVQPQNEPGYETRYPSCLWTAELLRDFVRDYLGPTFASRSVGAEIWFGTMSAPESTAHLDAVMADANSAQYVRGFGLQWNTIDSVGSLASNGFPVMQTEHKCGNYPWEMETFNPDRPPNDHAYAEESWGLIRDWINAGVNVYSAWNMVLDTQGQNLDEERPWPQNALLTVDRASGTLTVTPAYYVFRHLSYFVDPGAMRIAVNGTGDAVAFKNPDGSIITVVYNNGDQPNQMTLGVGGTAVQFEVPARGWASVNWE